MVAWPVGGSVERCPGRSWERSGAEGSMEARDGGGEGMAMLAKDGRADGSGENVGSGAPSRDHLLALTGTVNVRMGLPVARGRGRLVAPLAETWSPSFEVAGRRKGAGPPNLVIGVDKEEKACDGEETLPSSSVAGSLTLSAAIRPERSEAAAMAFSPAILACMARSLTDRGGEGGDASSEVGARRCKLPPRADARRSADMRSRSALRSSRAARRRSSRTVISDISSLGFVCVLCPLNAGSAMLNVVSSRLMSCNAFSMLAISRGAVADPILLGRGRPDIELLDGAQHFFPCRPDTLYCECVSL